MTPSPMPSPPRQGVEVDVDQVVRHAAGQPAHEQHLEVLEQLLRGDAEGGGRLVDADLAPRLEVGHQRQQPGDLVLGAAPPRSRSRRRLPVSAEREPVDDALPQLGRGSRRRRPRP